MTIKNRPNIACQFNVIAPINENKKVAVKNTVKTLINTFCALSIMF